MARLITNDPTGSAVPSRWPHRSVNLPPTSRIAAPASGSAITSHISANTPSADAGLTTGTAPPSWNAYISARLLVLQQAGVVDGGRAPGPEDGHDDREPDDDLGGGHHHHEERRDLAVEVAVLPGEGDQRQVGGVEHQLHAHEDHDRVAPGQDPDAADREEDAREDDVRHHVHAFSPPGAAGAASVVVAGAMPSRPACGAPPSWPWICSMSSASAGAERTVPRAASTRDTEASAGVPSGSSAGVSTALWRA